MSKSTKSQRKTRYQGTTITLEQYQLLYAYIRHDVTPSRRSLNNSAIPRPPRCSSTSREQVVNFSSLKRFKGIASRLEYRTTDDELVFKVGSRILLPNSRFNEVITEAHSSAGYKHLNLRCTIEKVCMMLLNYFLFKSKNRIKIVKLKQTSSKAYSFLSI